MDGAYNFKRVEFGVVISNHDENCFEYSIRMDFQVINNVIEYEALIFGFMILKKLRENNIVLYINS